jgi:predicted transcriptional regulator
MGKLNKGQLNELKDIKNSIKELEEDNIDQIDTIDSRVILDEYKNNIKHYDNLKATRRIMGYDNDGLDDMMVEDGIEGLRGY